jgi:ureidoacrylate peracid hydrolase
MKVEINPKETAVIIIDMQKDFMKRLGEVVKENKVIENINEIVNAAKKVDIPVFFVRTVRRKDGADSIPAVTDTSLNTPPGQKRPPVLVEGTPGSEIIDDLKVKPEDYIITKRRGNAFYNTDLELLLRSRGVRTVIIAGLITNACIDATTKGARERDFNVIIPIDTTATMSKEIQDFYIKNVFPRAAVTMTSAETVEALSKA